MSDSISRCDPRRWGRVPAEVVAATFDNFSPGLFAKSIPHAWTSASPQAVTALRYEIV